MIAAYVMLHTGIKRSALVDIVYKSWRAGLILSVLVNKWNIGIELNWIQQIHADDDDDVVDKNPDNYQ